MALLFSAVTLDNGSNTTKFLVGGVPGEQNDLSGYTAYESFMEHTAGKNEVKAHIKAYLYGEGETVTATPYELAYFMKRIEMDSDFLAGRCDNIEYTDFTFRWSPDETYRMEMG